MEPMKPATNCPFCNETVKLHSSAKYFFCERCRRLLWEVYSMDGDKVLVLPLPQGLLERIKQLSV